MRYPRMLASVFAAVCLFAIVPLASPGTDQTNTRTIYYDADYYITRAQCPCLTEAIHITGSYWFRLHVVINPGGGYSWQEHAGALDFAAVGGTTGETYRYVSGPTSWVENGSTDAEWDPSFPFELTFNNHDHIKGPGQLQDVFVHTVWHLTLDRTTGDLKVEVIKYDATCK
jgi:hypothetical protein